MHFTRKSGTNRAAFLLGRRIECLQLQIYGKIQEHNELVVVIAVVTTQCSTKTSKEAWVSHIG